MQLYDFVKKSDLNPLERQHVTMSLWDSLDVFNKKEWVHVTLNSTYNKFHLFY